MPNENMDKEIIYSQIAGSDHIKKLGQYFTNRDVADFMCSWACQGAQKILDPAVGNSVFFTHARKYSPQGSLVGYEIDPIILNYFGNPTGASIHNSDYLLTDWTEKYDAIVCNPPYNRFQAIENRENILNSIETHTGVKYSAYTNLYVLFLIKSIYQLSDTGRLAYIIPTEFLNSKYGIPIKRYLVDNRILRAIINFDNNHEMFFNATTTCCVLLIDKSPKKYVEFYNLSSINDLKNIIIGDSSSAAIQEYYNNLVPDKKWRSVIHHESPATYRNLTKVSSFCTAARGVATGANEYFCLSHSDLMQYHIPDNCVSKCICRSADVTNIFFDEKHFNQLSEKGKKVYLLDVSENQEAHIQSYLQIGLEQGIDKKYLPSHRKPWYSMEKKRVAPIWVSSACRNNMKFVRNLTDTNALTTFHSIYIHPEYESYTNLIFCYFLTSVAQSIIKQNRKELGNGLDKFQPNDFNNAKMLDIRVIKESDVNRINHVYSTMCVDGLTSHIDELNTIFTKYLSE
ncbi:MAG: N-6 DNA methylase [Clostridia bacterium]|nr:N-6 DNA methylase [Clostridia bacterium]